MLISRCLLGVPCRYHGQTHRRGRRIGRPGLVARLRRRYRLIDVCPEVDAGMPTPRPPTRIVDGRWICAGKDVTEDFERGARLVLAAAQRYGCSRAYLLGQSPACDREVGMGGCFLRENGIRVIRV